MPAYIIGTGIYLPGLPIDNDQFETRLGLVGGKASRFRKRVLTANGIEQRYLALDESGIATHLNMELAANAMMHALKDAGIDWQQIGKLGVGTTLPDIAPPGFDVMVHAQVAKQLGQHALETIACSGVCMSAMKALKACVQSILLGEIQYALVSGSERASMLTRGPRYEQEFIHIKHLMREIPGYNYFHADFLRWTLSDGAGSWVLSDHPKVDAPCFRIDHITITSYADRTPVCMYGMTNNPHDIRATNIAYSCANATDADRGGMVVLRQDHRVLSQYIFDIVAQDARHQIDLGKITDQVDLFIGHYSSEALKAGFLEAYHRYDVCLPEARWYSSLRYRGNVGSASIFVSLHDAMAEGRLKPGDKILLMVPESARFSVAYLNLTVC